MKFKTLDDINVKGKTVLLRIDINTEISKGKARDSPRFKAHAETVKELKKKGAKIVVLAHQSRPGKSDFISLKQHSIILSKYVKIKFVEDVIGEKAFTEIKNLKNGNAILLENVRFLKSEFKGLFGNKMVRFFSKNVDFYVNDAFSLCHRNQASITLLPRKIPNAIGRVLENEINNLDKLKENLKDSVFILGGAKVEDLMYLMSHEKILTTGTLSLLCLIAKGYDLGKEEDILKNDFKHLKTIKKYLVNTINPIDVAVNNNGRKEISLSELPSDKVILDVGRDTIDLYKKEIVNAKAIFVKGVPGVYYEKGFDFGTKEILKAVGNAKGFSVVAGGSSSKAVEKFKVKGINYVSLSGGALVYYLAGKKLKGLEVLKSKKRLK